MIGSTVKCVYDFLGETEDDLSLSAGDLVKVTKVVNESWLEGVSKGITGQFPKSFVEPTSEVFEVAIAVNTFEAEQDGDLPLSPGEYVVISEVIDDNWMRGYKKGGQEGMFPKAYVKFIDLENNDAVNEPAESKFWLTVTEKFLAQESNELDLYVGMRLEFVRIVDGFWCEGKTESGKIGVFPKAFVVFPPEIDIPKTPPDSPQSEKQMNYDVDSAMNPIIAKALYSFESDEKGDLSFSKDDEIEVLVKIDERWLKGHLNGQTGIFPSDYVTIIESTQTAIVDKLLSFDTTTKEVNQSETQVSPEIDIQTTKPVTDGNQKLHKKKPAPTRPKLPVSKKNNEEDLLLNYAFDTKSQPYVIIPFNYRKANCPIVVVLRRGKVN